MTNKPVWAMTPKQYCEHRIRAIMARHGCSRREAQYCLALGYAVQPDHLQAISQAARDGERIPNVVLDRLPLRVRLHVLQCALAGGHDDLYAGYVHPEFRRRTT